MKHQDPVLVALAGLREVKAPPDLAQHVSESLGLGDRYFEIGTMIGRFFVAFNARSISALVRAEDEQAFETWFLGRTGRPISRCDAIPEDLLRSIMRTLRGDPAEDIEYDLSGMSEFERAVLEKIREIPRGEVRSYAWVARQIGRPKAVRAVGSALGRNPIPLLIPCHRVIRSDGSSGQYGLGAESKKLLLEAEAARRSIA